MFTLVVSVFSYDVWFYISHLILHTPTFYKYHHEHHLAEEPIFIDTYKAHVVETLFQGVGMFFPLAIYKYTIVDLLLVLTYLNIRGMMRHDRRFAFLVGEHHLLHHKYHTVNYGEFWIDSLFGTIYRKKNINRV